MKFSWKVFSVTYIGMLAAIALAGTLLVSVLFYNTLEGEQSSVQREHILLNRAVASTIDSYKSSFYSSQESIEDSIFQDLEQNDVHDCGVRIRRDEQIVYKNQQYLQMKHFFPWIRIKHLHQDHQIAYSTCKWEGDYYIQNSSVFYADGIRYELETFHNVTSFFHLKNRQIRLLLMVMLIVAGFGGIIILGITHKLTKPITQLSEKAEKVARGNLFERMEVTGNDEVGELASNFNLMAESLEKNIEDLREAANRQEQFVGNFSHEIKTPLTTIIGHADLLRSRIMTDEQIFASANYIFQEGKRLESLSQKLLRLIVEGDGKLEKKATNTKAFMDEILYPLFSDSKYEKISFHTAVLPANISIDRDLMRTVVLNLIDNARKAMVEDEGLKTDEKGNPIRNLLIEGKRIRGFYCITIGDTGIGMKEVDLKHISEPFYMVDKSRARALGGAGLGLALCHKIIELHHGKIEYQSVTGEGTTVHIFLEEA